MTKKETSERTQTTTRIHTDTLSVLRMIADHHGISVLHYLDVVAREAWEREGTEVLAGIKKWEKQMKEGDK